MPAPTVLDVKLRPIALDLINLYGKEIVLRTSTKTKQANLTSVESNVQTQTIRCTPPEPYDARLIDGDLIKYGDMRIYVAAKDLTLTLVQLMTVAFDGATWTCMSVGTTYSGELPCLYELQLRRG